MKIFLRELKSLWIFYWKAVICCILSITLNNLTVVIILVFATGSYIFSAAGRAFCFTLRQKKIDCARSQERGPKVAKHSKLLYYSDASTLIQLKWIIFFSWFETELIAINVSTGFKRGSLVNPRGIFLSLRLKL